MMKLTRTSHLARAGSLLAALVAVSAFGASVPLAASADHHGPPSPPMIDPCGTALPIAKCPTEGPTVLEVGNTFNGDVPADWTVVGYGYRAGDTYKVKIINVKTGKTLDNTTAKAQNNGTITAQSPVYYIPPSKKGLPSLVAGWFVTHPLPLCGVTLQAVLTDVSSGTSQKVDTPVCTPPPPIH
jgi:hypothetical protein